MSSEKTDLHPRNRNRQQYDIPSLVKNTPALAKYVRSNSSGESSVDFANANAVKVLNKALLSHYYGLKQWSFPETNLCPPIPGRADYVHYMADLLSEDNGGVIPKGDQITCLDIGVGASCIYPILGVLEYGWQFIGTDIASKSIYSSKKIVKSNEELKGKVTCMLQPNAADTFKGVLEGEVKIDLSICNPPFHASVEDAQKEARRKVLNLTGRQVRNPELNFAGIQNELVCDGGEYKFIVKMVRQSAEFAKDCFWFSTLVSKQSNLNGIYKTLEKVEASQVKTIAMGTGNKSTRIVAWTFLSEKERKEWVALRWAKNEG